MSHTSSKGWYVQKLKEYGIRRHPTGQKKIENYKTHVLRNMYYELLEENKEKNY